MDSPRNRRPLPHADLYRIVNEVVTERLADLLPYTATIDSLTADIADILRPENDVADGAAYEVLQSAVSVGDEVIVLPLAEGRQFILNRTAGIGMTRVYMTDAAPTVASNNSTTTYQTLSTLVVTPPPGTWQGLTFAFGSFKNSVAGNGTTIRIASPSTTGGWSETSPTANAPHFLFRTDTAGALTGPVTFTSEYRASGGGTVTPTRAGIIAVIYRTS